MKKRNTAKGTIATSARLDALIEEATVDCYDDEEQATGFFTMIDDNLAMPFATKIFGLEVSVIAIMTGDDRSVKAVCQRGGERQRIALIDLPLPSPPPSGAEWIAAYRRWVKGSRHDEEEEE